MGFSFAFDGDVRNLALVPIQPSQQGLVAAVDVVAEFELAGIVDEGGLVSQVHGE